MDNISDDPIAQAEQLYYALAHNVTIEAKNVIWHFINTAKQYYPKSEFQAEWKQLLNHLSDVINDFENELPNEAELKLFALQKNLAELLKKETNK